MKVKSARLQKLKDIAMILMIWAIKSDE